MENKRYFGFILKVEIPDEQCYKDYILPLLEEDEPKNLEIIEIFAPNEQIAKYCLWHSRQVHNWEFSYYLMNEGPSYFLKEEIFEDDCIELNNIHARIVVTQDGINYTDLYIRRVHPIFKNDTTGISEIYCQNLILHNVLGPAIIYANGSTKWYLNGLLHREDGPAIEFTSTGDKFYFKNGKRHREDGPANIWGDGDKEWYVDNLLHRTDGPAIEYANGKVEYWENGVRIKK